MHSWVTDPFGFSDFDPVPELNSTDADVTLVFLVKNAVFFGLVSDPLFSAQDVWYQGETPYYYSLDRVSVLGCVEQHQLCNPNVKGAHGAGGRTAPNGLYSLGWTNASRVDSISLNARQTATATRLRSTSIFYNYLRETIARTGTHALLVRNSLEWVDGTTAGSTSLAAAFYSSPLPDDWWTTEVTCWYNIGTAKMQRWAVNYIALPKDEPNLQINRTLMPKELDMCATQKTQNFNYTSFSLIGLIIIFAVGGAFIATNFVLSNVIGFIRKRTRKGADRRRAWIQDEALQLQRMAFEGSGLGTWRGKEKPVPITAPGEKFGRSGEIITGEQTYRLINLGPEK